MQNLCTAIRVPATFLVALYLLQSKFSWNGSRDPSNLYLHATSRNYFLGTGNNISL